MKRFTDCPACGSRHSDIRVDDGPEVRARFLAFSEKKYGGLMDGWLSHITLRVRQCLNCGHCWYEQQPEAEQLASMYAAGRRLHPKGAHSTTPTAGMIAEMRRLKRLVASAAAGAGAKPRLLDYGSGFGRWARAQVAAGFEVTAYEPSMARGYDEQAAKDGFRVVHELAALEGRIFDAINIEQVLEHIPDPGAAMADISNLCQAETVVRITVPNIERTHEGRELWKHWPFDGWRPHTMAPFEHLHGFTPRSLSALVSRRNFRSIAVAKLLRADPVLCVRQLARPLSNWLAPTKCLLRLG